ncbi:MAG: glutamate-1-semialdehyde 2,1-aminomutase [Anaerolineae bacterium]|nr:MAG: glutamate-1-semialdehyde 2,1-aminomutase [Anaerolineae bacterium]
MSLQGAETKKLFERAAKVIPHGVNSNFRDWGPKDTLVVTRAEGAYLWDADGKRYIDYRLGFGPIILGHSYPQVVEKVSEAIRRGTTPAWTTPLEIEVAERICRMCGVDKVRLANSGTEATMHALRIARAHTGREKFIKFEGQYHGMVDYFMFSTAGTSTADLEQAGEPANVRKSKGIPDAIRDYVVNLPFNDLERVARELESNGHQIAAIFVEPIMGNVASIMPAEGWLEGLRALCDEHGVVLVFDEVKTGFRVANGGAQELFGVRADLVTYAKALGNGFPIAAVAGKDEIMMNIGPGETAHGGTYSGNSVGVAAASATLELLENEPIIETIRQRGHLLMSGIGEVFSDAGIPHALSGVPAMFGISLGLDRAPTDLRSYNKSDEQLYERIGMKLSELGVQPDADGREPWFLSYSHSEADVTETLSALETAIKEVKH